MAGSVDGIVLVVGFTLVFFIYQYVYAILMFNILASILLFALTILIYIVSLFTDVDYSGGGVDLTGGADLQAETLKKYKHLRAKKKHPSFDEFCFPKSFSIQNQQKFAGEYMKPASPKTILIFHKIGAGKTCLSIQIGEKWKTRGRPLYIMPASLIPGFRNELRSKCANDNYLTDDERQELREVVPGGVEY